MEKCYIISRYSATTEEEREFNCDVTRFFCRKVLENGKIPIAPQIYCTQFLDDDDAADRRLGMALGLRELVECNSYFVVVVDGVISEGMAAELKAAGEIKMPGEVVCCTKKELVKRMRMT